MPDTMEFVAAKLHLQQLSGSIERFCAKWKIKEFAFFGSVLRQDFGPDSDVDVLIRLDGNSKLGFFDLVRMEDELSSILGRRAEIFTRRGLEMSQNEIRKRDILQSAEVVYAAA
jgi:hypothetical protein